MTRRLLILLFFLVCAAIGTRAGLKIAEYRGKAKVQAETHHCAAMDGKEKVTIHNEQDGRMAHNLVFYAGGQDEPGNPNHEEPTKNCATNPKAGQIGCKCAHKRTCDDNGNPIESRTCKSFCWKHYCTCLSPPCP